MVTITKTSAGTFKAIIRNKNRVIKTKTFRLKKDARTWSKSIEGDRDAMTAYGSPGAAIKFTQLADEYLDHWTGRDKSLPQKVAFWKERLGKVTLINIDTPMIKEILNCYAEGDALRSNGTDSHGRPKLVNTGRKRTPATVNRIRTRSA